MSLESPIITRWDGDAFIPINKAWAKRADADYVVDEVYRIAPLQDRSQRSHSHYFACVQESWLNLSEHLSERFPSSEHLRKHALIEAGYRDERSIVCASKAEALRVAAFIRPIDDYAVVIVRDSVVISYTAKSQSMRAMGKEDFQKSKDSVLGILAKMIGVKDADLRREVEDMVR